MPAENEHEATWYVWPLGDILEELADGANVAGGPGLVLPEGLSPETMLVENPDGTFTLRVQPAFAEGRPAGYVSADVWLDIPDVWLQPAYLQVESASPPPVPIAGAPVLIDVSEESLFYSPFWNMKLAVVGPGADPNAFASTRALLDARPPLPLLPGGWSNLPIVPDAIVPVPAGGHLVDPTFGFDLPDLGVRPGRYDGEDIHLLDLGRGRFEVDGGGRVQAVPLFAFARRDAEGGLTPLDLPRVAGVGPQGSGRPAVSTTNPQTGAAVPRLGMFWHLVLVALPAGADAFQPAMHAAAVAAVETAGQDVRELQGRVAVNASCFDAADFPAGCVWLDSQSRIESTLPRGALIGTEINLNCTFLSFDKVPVPR